MSPKAAKTTKPKRLKPRLPKGMRDIEADEIRAMTEMLGRLRDLCERYGFDPLDTPAFEYSDALGKFLPDQDRPNEGVFSFEDDDGQWLSLRYDLTAPLARYVAANYDSLPKPFRRYQTGPVWRNEKPGPGRFRQFTQFDADTVGAASMSADAELCMLAADCLESLGIQRGDYVIRINNRKILDGVLEGIGLDPADPANAPQRLTVLRAVDKLDRLGREGVAQLLGAGRKDESGDFTPGAGLSEDQAQRILAFVGAGKSGREATLAALETVVGDSAIGREGVAELRQMHDFLTAGGFGDDRVVVDPAVVRGLDYYTGPVFEAELTFTITDETGRPVRFGSVGGGGRYDGLVARFRGTQVPATGFSIGVSRLLSALRALGEGKGEARATGPVVVLVMDREAMGEYQRMTAELRQAGVRAEMYLGESGMRAQMKYADRRGAPCVVIRGEEERARGEVMIKDLVEGARLSQTITDNVTWREGRPAQFAVPEGELVAAVQELLARQAGEV